jgi:hypothetical protein
LIVAQKPRPRTLPGRAGSIEHALRLLLGRVEAGANGEVAGSGARPVPLVREHMLRLGLDPDARMSNLPLPPVRGVTRLQPNAIVRRGR